MNESPLNELNSLINERRLRDVGGRRPTFLAVPSELYERSWEHVRSSGVFVWGVSSVAATPKSFGFEGVEVFPENHERISNTR